MIAIQQTPRYGGEGNFIMITALFGGLIWTFNWAWSQIGVLTFASLLKGTLNYGAWALGLA